ncbi:MAG TPA: MBOAT family O-acyltransferase [Phycisphaerae bacterium]|nr:MBOAT family O-acyltransferase [Phycisphaerae bacterium]
MVCLATLGTFKYYGFFATQLVDLLGLLGLGVSLPTLRVLLPVGISFFTFQTMSYTVDVYRGKAERARSLLDFALFVAFFPQLVAGPIERYTRLMPQITQPRRVRPNDFTEGLYFILAGLFAKIVIADNMAELVNAVFASTGSEIAGPDCLVGMYGFAFQIYGDFAGYSSIALGVAKWLGFDLMVNFRMPYFATSPSDFWRRWHISLSSWLRDYLYIPLGGNRRGRAKTLRNLFITMGLGGLWHGAAWTFVTWGLYHGAVLCAYSILDGRDAGKADARRPGWKTLVRMLVMFHIVCLGFLVFRAESMSQVWMMLGKIATDWRLTHFSLYAATLIVFFVGPFMALEFWLYRKDDVLALVKAAWPARAAVYGYFLLMLWFFGPEVSFEFIYFQF